MDEKGKTAAELSLEVQSLRQQLALAQAEITAWKNLKTEAEIKRLASFPQLNPSPILEIDATGAITFHNQAALTVIKTLGSMARLKDFLPKDLEEIQTAARQRGVDSFYREVSIADAVFAEHISFALPYNVLRVYAVDITDRKRAENIMQARLRLLKFAESHSLDEFTQATLDESEALTASTIGFYHLVEADQQTLALQSWSTNTLQNMCTAEGKGRHYDIAEAGVWVDSVQQRRPVIHNNYEALTHRRGMPPGHAPVVRELVVPIFRGDKIVAIIGVGNKPSDYNEQDVEAVSLLGDLSWDITERKQAEQALRERTAEVEFANRELESFSYSVSHDLKAPVRAIEGFSRMLLDEHARKLDVEALRLLNVLRDNAKVMHHLIDDLLALSRLGRMQVRKSVVNLSAMARKVFDRLREQASDRNLKLTIGDLPLALGDQSLLHQVLENLLSNAIKYSNPRETALIEVGGRDEEDETVYYVKDNGIGFDERYADKLFGVFQRLHGVGEYEGTGVGLAIVKRIIERHGGRVWAEGRVDQGATFYFALPKNGG